MPNANRPRARVQVCVLSTIRFFDSAACFVGEICSQALSFSFNEGVSADMYVRRVQNLRGCWKVQAC